MRLIDFSIFNLTVRGNIAYMKGGGFYGNNITLG